MTGAASRPFRQDIQALRGIAVLLVLLYHTQLAFRSAGYLGVDIFFVISGFLITGNILGDLDRGTFSFARFYARRARRILPAAFVTVALTYGVAQLFVTVEVQGRVAETALAALVFLANISLWQQTDYFSGAAALQPLLHMWSLAIEEQFYLGFPLLLFLLPARLRLPVVAALSAASLILCLGAVAGRPSATFYLLPTRAWELGIGALIALTPRMRGGTGQIFPAALLGVLLAVPALAPGKAAGLPHPGPDALAVCLATALILIRPCPWLDSGPAARILAWFGGISYSLYLVHWPLVAFLNNAYVLEAPPLPARLGAAAASVALALALFHLVEKPMRHGGSPRPLAHGTVIAAAALIGLGAVQAIPRPTLAADLAHRLRPNRGLDPTCDYGIAFMPRTACMTGPEPEIMVWGDSYAMHLVPALAVPGGTALIQATKSVCGPFPGIVPRHRDARRPDFPAECAAFNGNVMAHIAEDRALRIIVLSSVLNQYLFGAVEDPMGIPLTIDPAGLAAEIARTADAIRAAGKAVVLVAPTPSEGAGYNPEPGYDTGLCLERRLQGLAVLGVPADCTIRADLYRRREAAVLSVVDLLEETGRVPILRLDTLLCDAVTCATRIGDVLLYRDKGHLSPEGARELGLRHDLLERIEILAR